jgi:hypothetical protein
MEQGASQSKAAHGNVRKMRKEMLFGTKDLFSRLPKRDLSRESSWCGSGLYSRTPMEAPKYGQARQSLDASDEWSAKEVRSEWI